MVEKCSPSGFWIYFISHLHPCSDTQVLDIYRHTRHCTYRASSMNMKAEQSPRAHEHNGLVDGLMLGSLYLVILNKLMFPLCLLTEVHPANRANACVRSYVPYKC